MSIFDAKNLEERARNLGFADVFYLEPAALPLWRERAMETGMGLSLPSDIPARWPWAGAIALLIWAYKPFTHGERISPYYLASDAAYKAARALEDELMGEKVRCEAAMLPIRALCLKNGLGAPGKNGLISIGRYGTRMALQTLVMEGEPSVWHPFPQSDPCGARCTLCAEACPMGAISADGFDVRRCMRYIMAQGEYTAEVREAQRTFMGCELCQSACAKNKALGIAEVPGAAREAFELKRLICGDAAQARAMVGRNATANGRLTAEAIAFAAREGLYEGEIRACLDSPFERVRNAAKWAICRYFT